MTIALPILLLILFIILIIILKKDILEPSILFTFSFLLLSIMALLNAKRFKLGLHLNTFIVVLGGVLLFTVTCFCVKYLYNKFNKNKVLNVNKESKLKANNYIKVLFIICAIVFNFIYIYFIMRSTSVKFTGINSVMKAISTYDSMLKFSDDYESVKLPFLITNARMAFLAMGYWFIYVIIHNYIFTKKISVLDIICVVPCLIVSLLEGSRTPIFYLISTAVFIFLTLLNKKKGFGKILSLKLVLFILIIGSLVVFSFKPIANLLGRNIQSSFTSYISVYCGAELKNLDIFLNSKHKNNNIVPGAQTFSSLIKSYGSKVGFKGYEDYHLDLPFRHIGKVSLGNVYTTFYPYIYDFGYLGLVFLVMVMASISQVFYETIKRHNLKDVPNKMIILYGYIGTCLLLSFFSNKFYENLFSITIIKFLVVWIIADYIFIKNFKMKEGSNNEKE